MLLFDPTNAQSAAYNPLLEVRRGEWEVRDVQNVADILVDPEGALERRNHWEKTSHSLLVGAILHVLYAEADKTLAGVAAFLSDPKRPIEATLAGDDDDARIWARPASIRSSPRPRANCSTRARMNARACCRPPCRSSGSTAIPWWRQVTRRCDWRIADLVEGDRPATLYLVVPPSDISRTKPLVRLVLNQIGRRLTEDLHAKATPASVAADARRVSGARPARFLRDPRSPSWRATG